MDKTEFALEYTPTLKDVSKSLARGQSHTPRGPFLSVDGATSYIVHGNSYVRVLEKGVDRSGNYSTWRRMRVWALPPGVGLAASGPPDFDWLDDNLSGNPNWTDMPAMHLFTSPDQWTSERMMHEFVVAVDGHPEFGAVYCFVVVSTAPKKYRVEMSSGKNIPFKKWAELAKTTQPWAASSGCTIAIDSGWMTAS